MEKLDINNFCASEIWESGFSVGCSDYAILFATFARQLGYPTTKVIINHQPFDF